MESLVSVKSQSWLSWFLKGILVFGFLFLTGRLIGLQIIKGDHFRSLANENRIKRVAIFAPRGKITARGGEVLVGNNDKGRDYVLGPAFSHVSGYVSESNADEVGKVDPGCPDKGPRKLGSIVGRDGLEQYYDCRLRGIDGERLIEVDTAGSVMPLGITSPSFSSFDYIPLIPWLGIFLAGGALGKTVYASKRSLLPWRMPQTFVNFAGRHALLIYIVHQPVIMGVLYALGLVR